MLKLLKKKGKKGKGVFAICWQTLTKGKEGSINCWQSLTKGEGVQTLSQICRKWFVNRPLSKDNTLKKIRDNMWSVKRCLLDDECFLYSVLLCSVLCYFLSINLFISSLTHRKSLTKCNSWSCFSVFLKIKCISYIFCSPFLERSDSIWAGLQRQSGRHTKTHIFKHIRNISLIYILETISCS